MATLLTLALGIFAGAQDLPKLDGLFTTLTEWLAHIITIGGGFFLLIDMAKHLFSSPRDLRAAGIDLAIFAVLLAVANQAPSIAAAVSGLIK